ncbi:MAG: hypothetical protein SH807_02785 [Blastochloris sp.]|nr:hypothetical protein [Blastochloris sp.]
MQKKSSALRAAVLDLGSNSIKFMLGEQVGGTLRIIKEKATTTRLGGSLALTNKLSDQSITETLEVLRRSKKEADAFGITKLLAVGTSALRSASNSHEVLIPAREILQIPIQIISGKKEGELVYAGATCSSRWKDRPVLIIDLGGGSAEFVIGQNGKVTKSVSLPLGCVRIKDLFLNNQPPDPLGLQNAKLFLQTEVKKRITKVLPEKFTAVATGGTMITLSLIHRQLPHDAWDAHLEGTKISKAELHNILSNLSTQSVARLKKNPSIPHARADIITAGALIYTSIMEALNVPNLYCATHGLRYGVWQEMIAPRPIKRIIHNHTP